MTSLNNTQPNTFDLKGFVSALADAIRKLVEIVRDAISASLQLANWGISLANPTMKGIARLIEDLRNAGFYIKGFGNGLLVQFKEESVWAEFPYAEEIISVASGYTQRFGTSKEMSQRSGEEDAKAFLSWMGIGREEVAEDSSNVQDFKSKVEDFRNGLVEAGTPATAIKEFDRRLFELGESPSLEEVQSVIINFMMDLPSMVKGDAKSY